MKTYTVKTTCSPKLVKLLEDFYENANKEMERNFRNMLLEYLKTEGVGTDDYFVDLMNDLYFLFQLIDACVDVNEKEDKLINAVDKKGRGVSTGNSSQKKKIRRVRAD